MSWRASLRLAPFLAIILIDSIGYTIVVPVLAPLLIDEPALMMADSSRAARYFVYGAALGVFEIMMLYMAPVLGEISDRVGRQRILAVSLAGLAASFTAIGAAVALDSVVLLIIGRIVGGAMAGSQAVAQAAAVDLSTPQTKPLVLSLCLLASSLGFIIGPAIGGLLGHDATVTLLDFTTPLFLTAGLAVIGLLVLRLAPARSAVARSQSMLEGIDPWMGVRGFKAALATPSIRRLIVVFILMQIAWGSYFLFLPSLLLVRFDMDAGRISLVMASLGVGFCLAYGLCVPFLTKRFAIRSIAAAGLWVTTALMLISVLSHRVGVQWALAIPLGIAVSVAYGTIITLFSDSVEEGRQGWILGITIAATALAFGCASIAAGALSGLDYRAPFVLALAAMVASSIAVLKSGDGDA